MRVGDHSALLVGAPQAEGDEPGMQQSRMVGVLDVLLHQFPIPRDALAGIAEEPKRAPVEDAVEIAEHLGAEELLERLHIVVEGGEDDAVADRHLQLREAMLLQAEIVRHAAVRLAVLLDAAAKRQADEIAFEIVGPLVVGAGERGRVAEILPAEGDAPVRADILDDADRAVLVAPRSPSARRRRCA